MLRPMNKGKGRSKPASTPEPAPLPSSCSGGVAIPAGASIQAAIDRSPTGLWWVWGLGQRKTWETWLSLPQDVGSTRGGI